MGQLINWGLAGALAMALVGGLIVRYRRRRAAIPEVIKHPERLEEMLDSTDDA